MHNTEEAVQGSGWAAPKKMQMGTGEGREGAASTMPLGEGVGWGRRGYARGNESLEVMQMEERPRLHKHSLKHSLTRPQRPASLRPNLRNTKATATARCLTYRSA